MYSQGERLRHIDDQIFKEKGVLTVIEVKNNSILCYVGDPFLGQAETFPLNNLKKMPSY